jgi:hypothetical protein
MVYEPHVLAHYLLSADERIVTDSQIPNPTHSMPHASLWWRCGDFPVTSTLLDVVLKLIKFDYQKPIDEADIIVDTSWLVDYQLINVCNWLVSIKSIEKTFS